MSRREDREAFDKELLDFANDLRRLNGKKPYAYGYEFEASARKRQRKEDEKVVTNHQRSRRILIWRGSFPVLIVYTALMLLSALADRVTG